MLRAASPDVPGPLHAAGAVHAQAPDKRTAASRRGHGRPPTDHENARADVRAQGASLEIGHARGPNATDPTRAVPTAAQ